MKGPKFLTIWLIVMLLFSVGTTVDSLTYLPSIRLTNNYLQLVGILANFVQIWALILLLQWKRMGITFLISATIAGILVASFDQQNVVAGTNQAIINIIAVLIFNLIVLRILYMAMKPVWKNFK